MKNYTKLLLSFALTVVLGSWGTIAFAQVPANDNCANAINLTSSLTCVNTAGTNVNSTASAANNACGGTTDDDVWYKFTAVSPRETVSVTNAGFDVVLDIRSGTCDGTNIACVNNSVGNPGPETANLTGLTVGAVYLIRVYSAATGFGTFDICVTHAPPPNDDCANATTLTVGTTCTPTAADNYFGTQSIPAINCGGVGNADDDVWFKFTAAYTDQTVTVSNPGFDAVIDVRSGACNGTNIACANAVAGTGDETVNLTGLTAGTVYYVRVYSQMTGIGTFNICVFNTPPANDDCVNAITLTSSNTCVSTAGNTATATPSIPLTTACGNPDDDIWYKFTAIYTQHTIGIGSPSIGPDVEAFSGTCGALVSLGCAVNAPLTLTGLTVGATYYFRVYSNGTGRGIINVCVTHLAPDNDNCAGAAPIAISPASGCTYTAVNTQYATQSAPNPSCTTTGNDDDVWFSFTPSVTGQLLISYTNLVGTAVTVNYELYTGTCGVLTAVAGTCGGIGSDLTTDDNELTVSLTAGTPYLMRVWGAGVGTTAAFNLCLQIPPPVPAYDDCANAVNLTSNTTCVNSTGTTVSATQTLAGVCGNADDDVWFKFTAITSAHTIQISNYSGFTCGVINAYSACAGTSLGCSTNGTLALTGLTAGTVYVFRVHSCALARGTFNVCVTHTAPLPIELKSFTGEVKGNVNVLNWETLTEKNVQSHIVERSIDGATWLEVGRKSGLANSTVSVKYTLEDRTPVTKAYYRLRSVDFDGKEAISNTVVLTRKNDQFGITSVFPSPTKSDVTVQFNATQEETVIVRVMDMTGRLVLEQTMEAAQNINELPLTLQGLQAGIYTVTVSDSTGASAPVRFVKQ